MVEKRVGVESSSPSSPEESLRSVLKLKEMSLQDKGQLYLGK